MCPMACKEKNDTENLFLDNYTKHYDNSNFILTYVDGDYIFNAARVNKVSRQIHS
jgi:hypothetical protein